MARNVAKVGPRYSSQPCYWCGRNIKYGKSVYPGIVDSLKGMLSFWDAKWVYCSERCKKAHARSRK